MTQKRKEINLLLKRIKNSWRKFEYWQRGAIIGGLLLFILAFTRIMVPLIYDLQGLGVANISHQFLLLLLAVILFISVIGALMGGIIGLMRKRIKSNWLFWMLTILFIGLIISMFLPIFPCESRLIIHGVGSRDDSWMVRISLIEILLSKDLTLMNCQEVTQWNAD